MRTKKCAVCGGKMIEKSNYTTDNLLYHYFHCSKCGDEILTMRQLHEAAEKQCAMKNSIKKPIKIIT